jgi:hypothetical protein
LSETARFIHEFDQMKDFGGAAPLGLSIEVVVAALKVRRSA